MRSLLTIPPAQIRVRSAPMRDGAIVATSVLISVSASYGLFYLSTHDDREKAATHQEVASLYESVGALKQTDEGLSKRIDLHAQLMTYADIGQHWWCNGVICLRTKEMCEISVHAKWQHVGEEDCLPRRNAWCSYYGKGPCAPKLGGCESIDAAGCIGVE